MLFRCEMVIPPPGFSLTVSRLHSVSRWTAQSKWSRQTARAEGVRDASPRPKHSTCSNKFAQHKDARPRKIIPQPLQFAEQSYMSMLRISPSFLLFLFFYPVVCCNNFNVLMRYICKTHWMAILKGLKISEIWFILAFFCLWRARAIKLK